MFDIYPHVLKHILDGNFRETNQRTGHEIKMLPYPVSLPIDLRSRRLPLPGNRLVFPVTAAAETAFFLSGKRDITWLRKHCKIWDKFTEDDGITVHAAYGYRARHHFGRDQISAAVECLRRDPSDRRIYVSLWDPSEDGLGALDQKNVPCPVGFTLSMVENHLNSAMMIRSSDVFVGLPYDVMGHALLMDAISKSIGAQGLGWLHVTLAHPHVYETHYEMARTSLDQTWAEKPKLPGWMVEEIVEDPDGYVAAVKDLADEVRPHPYFCRPEVVV